MVPNRRAFLTATAVGALAAASATPATATPGRIVTRVGNRANSQVCPLPRD